ncbi:hypothetical protein [Paracoccus simplex]|uniref:Sulfotransferase family protein n=1 Tax=Paracoccus simplex TaxID=2086346 RepID=A0ABV7RVB7_9RHOB
MNRTLYLHIGAHRTATSAIQRFLFVNCARLAELGYLQVNGAPRQAVLMRALAVGNRKARGVAEGIIRQCKESAHPIHSAILTDEDICCQRDLSYLVPFRDYFDVKVIFSLRRQDLWLESWYFQNIKWQWQKHLSHLTFPEFMRLRSDFHWINYNRYVKHLEKLFGKENILLTVHEKRHMKDGPIATFCRHMDLIDISDFENPGQVNPSFSPAMSEFMRQLPLDQSPEPYRAELESILYEIDRRTRPRDSEINSLLLSREDRERLLAEFETGNKAVANRYFGRDKLFEDPLPETEAPLADMRLPATSQEMMDIFVRPLVSGIIDSHKQKLASNANPQKR